MITKSLFLNQCFDKNRLKSLITWALLTTGEKRTIQIVETLKSLGFRFATQAGISLSLDDLKVPPEKVSLVSQAKQQIQATQQEYQKGNLTSIEKLQQLVDTWHRTSETLKQTVVNNFQATDKLSPVYMMAFSGARGNISQVRQLAGMRGLMADPQGQIIGFPIQSNFREGLTLTEYMISCYGARKGLVDTALRTADAGYLTRRLVDVSQHMVVKTATCATSRGIILQDLKASNKVIFPLRDRLIGRVLAQDVVAPISILEKEKWNKTVLLGSRNQEISSKLASQIVKYHNKIIVRSPLSCAIRHGVCQLCYGWSLSEGRLVTLGEAVGIIAAQSIGEPGTQLTMRTFHTGGVFSGDVLAEIRAPHDGIVNFLSPLQGLLIRTSHGKIAFLTKESGVLSLRQIKEDTSQEKSLQTELSLEASTILFVRHSEKIARTQLIAEFSSMGGEINETIEAKRILFAEISGQISFTNMVIGTRMTENGDILQISKNLGFIWILSGKKSGVASLLHLYTEGSHLVNENSLLARINSNLITKTLSFPFHKDSNSTLYPLPLTPYPLATPVKRGLGVKEGNKGGLSGLMLANQPKVVSDKINDKLYNWNFTPKPLKFIPNSGYWISLFRTRQKQKVDHLLFDSAFVVNSNRNKIDSIERRVFSSTFTHFYDSVSSLGIKQGEPSFMSDTSTLRDSSFGQGLEKGATGKKPVVFKIEKVNRLTPDVFTSARPKRPIFCWFPGYYKSESSGLVWIDSRYVNSKFTAGAIMWINEQNLACSFSSKNEKDKKTTNPLTKGVSRLLGHYVTTPLFNETTNPLTKGVRVTNKSTFHLLEGWSDKYNFSIHKKNRQGNFCQQSILSSGWIKVLLDETFPKLKNTELGVKEKLIPLTFKKRSYPLKEKGLLIQSRGIKKQIPKVTTFTDIKGQFVEKQNEKYNSDFLHPKVRIPSCSHRLYFNRRPNFPFLAHSEKEDNFSLTFEKTPLFSQLNLKLNSNSKIYPKKAGLETTSKNLSASRLNFKDGWVYYSKEQIKLATYHESAQVCDKNGVDGLLFDPSFVYLEGIGGSNFLYRVNDTLLLSTLKLELAKKNSIATNLKQEKDFSLFQHFLLQTLCSRKNVQEKVKLYDFSKQKSYKEQILPSLKTLNQFHLFRATPDTACSSFLGFVSEVDTSNPPTSNLQPFFKGVLNRCGINRTTEANQIKVKKSSLTLTPYPLVTPFSSELGVKGGKNREILLLLRKILWLSERYSSGLPISLASEKSPSNLTRNKTFEKLAWKNLINDESFLWLRSFPVQVKIIINDKSRCLLSPLPNSKDTSSLPALKMETSLLWVFFLHGKKDISLTSQTRPPLFDKVFKSETSLYLQIKRSLKLDSFFYSLPPLTPFSKGVSGITGVTSKNKQYPRFSVDSQNAASQLFTLIRKGYPYSLSIIARSKPLFNQSYRANSKILKYSKLAHLSSLSSPFRKNKRQFSKKFLESFLPTSFKFLNKLEKTKLVSKAPGIILDLVPLFPFTGFQTVLWWRPIYIIRFAAELWLPSNDYIIKTAFLTPYPLGIKEGKGFNIKIIVNPAKTLRKDQAKVSNYRFNPPYPVTCDPLATPLKRGLGLDPLKPLTPYPLARLGGNKVIKYKELREGNFIVKKIPKNVVLNGQIDRINGDQTSMLSGLMSPLIGEMSVNSGKIPVTGCSLGWKEKGGIKQASIKKNNVIVSEADQISFSTQKIRPKLSLGQFLNTGEEVIKNYAITVPGQVIAIEKEKITLRRAQALLFYAQGIIHVNHGEWVDKNAPILTLTYQKLVTGDIVQGIPKIEEFFEAPTTREGDQISNSLQANLRKTFQRLKPLFPMSQAVNKSLEDIQQVLVEGILKVYLSQGVRIADKHLEVVIRQMTSKGHILDVGNTGLFQGEDVNLDRIERINLATYGQKANYEPAVLGITQASLDSDSFISSASFQETTRVLSRDTIIGKTDFLRGLKERVVLGDLIQAGTGLDDNINYGLLFGVATTSITEQLSKKPYY